MKAVGGVVRERPVTDVFFSLMFVGYIILMVYVSFYGMYHGNIRKLMAPLDRNHNFCGFDQYRDYPNLYVAHGNFSSKTIEEMFNTAVCVWSCPTTLTESLDCAPADKMYCNSNDVLANRYETHDFIGFCMPDMRKMELERPEVYKQYLQAFYRMISSNPAGRVVQDIWVSAKIILSIIPLTFLYCSLYVYVVSKLAKVIAYSSMILIELSLMTVSLWCFSRLAYYSPTATDQATADRGQALVIFGGIIMIFALLFLAAICKWWKKIGEAAEVIDAAADMIRETQSLMLINSLFFLLIIFIIIFWAWGFMGLLSMGEITPNPNIPQGKFIKFSEDMERDPKLLFFLFVLIFGFFWLVTLTNTVFNYICMVSTSVYYFTYSEETEGRASLSTAFAFAFLKNFGSLCYGSLIISLVQFLKAMANVAESIERQQSSNSDDPANVALRVACCCCNCLAQCCIRLIDFVSTQGYAYMAVSGDPFCSSCESGFLLWLKHCGSFMLTHFFAGFFVFLGKMAVVFLNGISIYIFLKHVTGDLDELSALAGGPWIVMIMITFIFVSLFLGIFEQIVQSLMMCYAIDTDINGEALNGPPAFRNFSSERKALV